MKNLEKKCFPNYLWKTLGTQNNDPVKFLQICIGVLDRLAPQKKKYNRSNNMPFMNKALPVAHMKRSHLQNQCSKTGS